MITHIWIDAKSYMDKLPWLRLRLTLTGKETCCDGQENLQSLARKGALLMKKFFRCLEDEAARRRFPCVRHPKLCNGIAGVNTGKHHSCLRRQCCDRISPPETLAFADAQGGASGAFGMHVVQCSEETEGSKRNEACVFDCCRPVGGLCLCGASGPVDAGTRVGLV